MATSYTYRVAEGDLDFKAFAVRCAKNFGLLIHMRDDDLDAPFTYPERSTYLVDALEQAEAKFARLSAMSEEDRRGAEAKHAADAAAQHLKSEHERLEKVERYRHMLCAVGSWASGAAHTGVSAHLCGFMRSQLRESMKADGRTFPPPEPTPFDEMLESARRDVEYYRKAVSKDARLVAIRIEEIDGLCEALGIEKPSSRGHGQ